MEQQGRKSYDLMYRLLSAWLHDGVFGDEGEVNFADLYTIAAQHSLTAAVCAALESAGAMAECPPDIAGRFRDAWGNSIRRTVLMDAEREELFSFMERSSIWYLPLKGAVLEDYYPQPGTRQMADNDILFDAGAWRTVRKYMRARGYRVADVGKGAHDSYSKPPVYRFEMHRRLFADNFEDKTLSRFAAYYADVKEQLIKDEGNRYGWHFSPEDFYVYLMAHAYKHFSAAGTGVRILLDTYLYRACAPTLDRGYIAGELDRLGIREFEENCRSLGQKLFSLPCRTGELTKEERRTLARMEGGGTYGTITQHVETEMLKLAPDGAAVGPGTKACYIWRRIFPDQAWYRANAPFAWRHKWAVPLYWLFRLFRGMFKNGRRNLRVLMAACSYSGERRFPKSEAYDGADSKETERF